MAFLDQAGDFDGSTRLHTSPTPKSTSTAFLAGAKSTRGLHGSYVFNRGKLDLFGVLGGRIEVGSCNRAGKFDGSAWSHTSPTPQSTSDCVGGGRINQGIAGGHIFYRGKLEIFGVSKEEDRGDISQQGGQFQWIRLVTHLTHTTMNK